MLGRKHCADDLPKLLKRTFVGAIDPLRCIRPCTQHLPSYSLIKCAGEALSSYVFGTLKSLPQYGTHDMGHAVRDVRYGTRGAHEIFSATFSATRPQQQQIIGTHRDHRIPPVAGLPGPTRRRRGVKRALLPPEDPSQTKRKPQGTFRGVSIASPLSW